MIRTGSIKKFNINASITLCPIRNNPLKEDVTHVFIYFISKIQLIFAHFSIGLPKNGEFVAKNVIDVN